MIASSYSDVIRQGGERAMPPRRGPTAWFHVGERIRVYHHASTVEGVIREIRFAGRSLFYVLQDGTLIHDGAQPIELVLPQPSERALKEAPLTVKQIGVLLELAREQTWRSPSQIAGTMVSRRGEQASAGNWGSTAKLLKELLGKGLVRQRMNGYYNQKPWPRWEYRVSDAGPRWLDIHHVGETRQTVDVSI